LTRAFWEQKEKMAQSNAWWGGVTTDMLSNIYGKLHPGALRYYQEKGVEVPEAIR
jgi:TRAP-type uncharacterized transport system substrate-binding protein